MGSLREGIEKAQFEAPPATSMLSVAGKFGLEPPVSLLRVATLLRPETVDWDTGWVSSGDDDLMKAKGRLQLTSTGFWTFSGDVADNGDGAAFGFTMVPRFSDAAGMTLLLT